jgi:hypothetical protein
VRLFSRSSQFQRQDTAAAEAGEELGLRVGGDHAVAAAFAFGLIDEEGGLVVKVLTEDEARLVAIS